MGEGEPGLHLGILLGNCLQDAVGHGSVEPRLQTPAVEDLDLAAAVAVDRVADPANPRIEAGGAPLHLEREVDLPLRVDAGQPGRRQPGQRLEGAGVGKHVRLVGVVVAAVDERLIDEVLERLRLEVGGV